MQLGELSLEESRGLLRSLSEMFCFKDSDLTLFSNPYGGICLFFTERCSM